MGFFWGLLVFLSSGRRRGVKLFGLSLYDGGYIDMGMYRDIVDWLADWSPPPNRNFASG